MNCVRERCRRWGFVFAKLPDQARPHLVASHSVGAAARGSPARPPRACILCVDVLGFHIGLESSFELAHQRQ
jgi:hypothetical protein